MKAAHALQLHTHNGRLLTRPEILLDQFHARRNEEQKKLADEKMVEKLMLSRLSSKLITVPTVRFFSAFSISCLLMYTITL